MSDFACISNVSSIFDMDLAFSARSVELKLMDLAVMALNP
jgi:hypothetical protein